MRAGVAGAGVFGGYHADKYAATPGVRFSAAYDVDAEAARLLASRRAAEAHLDYERFLDAVDILTIAAPAGAHFELARRALLAGKHVLVEKPITLRLDHADELVAIAAKKGLVLQTGHQERFVFDALGLRGAQKPKAIHSRRQNVPSTRGLDASVVLDLMIHDLDLIRSMNVGAPAAIDAAGDSESASAVLTFPDGMIARLDASRRAESRERRMTLVYDDGKVEIDFLRRRILDSAPRRGACAFDVDDPALVDPLGLSVAKFVDAARRRGKAPVSGEDGRNALEWGLLIDAAISAERRVTVA